VGHAAGFWREISGDADSDPDMVPQGPVVEGVRLYRLFDTYSNLYADLSAGSAFRTLSRDLDHARSFIIRFADRLLFGRDYYGADTLPLLRSLDLPEDVCDTIYWQNAQRLVPIEGLDQPARQKSESTIT
jgi:predicted TIM-barrel fold metal-dependent hydrolase